MEEATLTTPEGHPLPAAPAPVSGPYYRWSELRGWFGVLADHEF